MRKTKVFNLEDVDRFKSNLLEWSRQFDEVVWLDGNAHRQKYTSFDALLAVDALTSIRTDSRQAFKDLSDYQESTNDWIFGYLSYDLKNDQEDLSSNNYDGLEFPELYFFQPKRLIKIDGKKAVFSYLPAIDDEIEADFDDISHIADRKENAQSTSKNIRIRLRIFKDQYFAQVNSLLQHIKRGDIYEANFCQEFYAQRTEIDPLTTYRKLNKISNAPFATFCKFFDNYLLCASPERYLRKEGQKVISQPIKGTAKRDRNEMLDNELKRQLRQDPKERSENIMIVDLVRNDLSKNAIKGSVQVEELCQVYSYEQVHQMTSTVSAQLRKEVSPVDVIRESFPMGSMTGAPKISAMKLIEQHESFKRGLYSGAVGYFDPEDNFDFNVVIRSILYNATKKYVSFSVGSAITAMARPEKEYEECLLKAKAMREVLET